MEPVQPGGSRDHGSDVSHQRRHERGGKGGDSAMFGGNGVRTNVGRNLNSPGKKQVKSGQVPIVPSNRPGTFLGY